MGSGAIAALRRGGGWSAFLIFAAYGLCHAIVGWLTLPSLALDDAKLNVLAQSYAGGYLADNPPLFEWMLRTVQLVAGPGLVSFLIVKYALWTVTGLACWRTFRLLGASQFAATAGAFGLVLFYQYGWNYHQVFTHSLALIASVALFWAVLIQLVQRPDLSRFMAFGAVLGIGALSKYSFLPAAAIALVVTISTREVRRVLINPRVAGYSVVALIISLLITSPHLVWLSGPGGGSARYLAARFRADEASYLVRIAEGLPQALWGTVSFFLPAALLFLVMFRRRMIDAVRATPCDHGALVLRRAGLCGLAVLPGCVILFGLGDIAERYAIAFLYPAALWLLLAVTRIDARAARGVFVVGAALAMVILSARLMQGLVAGPPFCDKCRQYVPYTELSDALAQGGYGAGNLTALNDLTAGNLRRLLPDARVRSAHLPSYRPPQGDSAGRACVFIWSDDLGPPAPVHVRAAIIPASRGTVTAVWPRDTGRPLQRSTTWHFGRIDPADPVEKDLCG